MWPSGTRGNSINASDKQVTGVPLLPTPSPWATTAAKKKTTTAHTFQEKGLNKSSGVHGFSQLLRRRVDTEGIVGYGSQGTWYRICGIDQGGGSWGYGRNSSHTTLFPSAPVNEPTSFCACTLSWAATVKLLPFHNATFFCFFRRIPWSCFTLMLQKCFDYETSPDNLMAMTTFSFFFLGGGDCSFNKESRVWRKHHI